jgi:UDP-3-O-[3-hydroxymyristoyl] glucosamine N-acyltransferase
MLAKIQDARKGQVAFLSNPKYEHFIYTTQASAVIVKRDFIQRKELNLPPLFWSMTHTPVLQHYWKSIINLFRFRKVALNNLPFKVKPPLQEKIFTEGLSRISEAM